MRTAKVYVKFPRTGLGNMMLTWSRGMVFAHLNGLPLVTSPWGKIQWGAWIRRERKKRTYWGYFSENSAWERVLISLREKRSGIVREPAVEKLPVAPVDDRLYVFDEVSPGKDLFAPFRDHRLLVRQGIFDLLLPAMRERLRSYPPPVIAVHIRRGDFKFGNPITPTDFFIDAIRLAREASGKELPVTVFTDARPDEIKEVLDLPAVKLAEDKPDILDILLMSQSRMIVLSQSSTFSYWGAFLSEAIIIKPEGDWQDDLRPAEINSQLFEGSVNLRDPATVAKLTRNLQVHQW